MILKSKGYSLRWKDSSWMHVWKLNELRSSCLMEVVISVIDLQTSPCYPSRRYMRLLVDILPRVTKIGRDQFRPHLPSLRKIFQAATFLIDPRG